MRNMNSVKVRRDHKDTLFRMIFSTRENLLSLSDEMDLEKPLFMRVASKIV